MIILNDKGLHTRPSTELVKCASQYQSMITLTYKKSEVNAKSLLGLLMLAAEKGAKIKIEAEGEDAKEAVEAVLKLAKLQFYMDY